LDSRHDVPSVPAGTEECIQETVQVEEEQLDGTEIAVENGQREGLEESASGLREVEERVSATLMLQVG
jgi:hypothetical protein